MSKSCASRNSFKNSIPGYLHKALPDEILSANLQEEKANCDNCAMTKKNRGEQAKITYRPDLKCCTFQPMLPNFSVGALLSDTKSVQFVEYLENRIQKKDLILPLGVLPSVSYQIKFNGRHKNDFGQDTKLLCDYFDKKNNQCSVWMYRGSVCTSFFCFSDWGTKGMRFWDHLQRYFHYIEMALAEECLVQLDFSPRQIVDLHSYMNLSKAPQHLKNGIFNQEQFIKIWNSYSINEILSFYQKCNDIASQISKEDLHILLGEYGENLFRSVKKSFNQLLINPKESQ